MQRHSWCGFANEGDRKRFDRLIARMRRSGYLSQDFPILAALVDEADGKLFRSNSNNVTHVVQMYVTISPVSLNIATE